MPTTTRIAKVFDGAADGVPYFLPEHPRLSPADRTGPLAYLAAGAELLITPENEADIVDPARGRAVPTGFRTDGSWIWHDALAYYLAEYGLAPEPGFLAAMQAADWACPTPDDAAVERALEELFAD